MLGITCEKNCPGLSWDFVEIQLIIFGGLWGLLLWTGLILNLYRITNDMDEFQESVEILQNTLQTSKFYVYSCTFFAIFQCAIFSLRTFTKTVDGLTFLIEVIGCLFFFFNLILSWLSKSLRGFTTFAPFMFTRAFIDTLLFPSVLCLVIVKVDGEQSWFSFSYIAALHILTCWRWILEIKRVNTEVLMWQVIDVTVNCLVLVFFAAMMMMTLENLGDPSWLEDMNEEKWNTLSALYYVFVTISTVGYGDLAPVTGLGRTFAIVTIFSGISAVVLAMFKILKVLNIHSSGGGTFVPRVSCRHVVVTGNPPIFMALDFIAEVFHDDHADDAEDLHLVFLLPRGTKTMAAIQHEMTLRKNVHIAPRVHLYQGSVLERRDLQRVAPLQSSAIFVLPNVQCKDYMHEDTEDIIRLMAILKVNPHARTIILLMKAENQQLLHDSGYAPGTNITCLSIDQFKLELIGKSCQVPGFSTMICNLFKTIGDMEDEDYSKLASWMPDYDKGTGNEIYEVELSLTYSERGAVFSEVVLDVIEQTDGAVYLIGLVEITIIGGAKRVIVNPGTWYPIKDAKNSGVVTLGIFIAADRDAVQQCEGGVFLGRRERPAEESHKMAGRSVIPKDTSDREFKRVLNKGAEKRVEAALTGEPENLGVPQTHESMDDGYVDPLEDLIRRDPNLNKQMQASARNLIQLAKQHKRASLPARMPLKQLASGGHILFCCIGVQDGEELRLGAEHFLKPLRGRTDSPMAHESSLLILSPVPPRDWHRCSEDKKVFYMRGSPLSLFDLERANFRSASNIIILHVGTPRVNLSEAWMVDSDVVCCARLVESELPQASQVMVIAEIAVDSNHPFIPLPGLTALGEPAKEQTPAADGCMPEICFQCGSRCADGAMACMNCGAVPADEFDEEAIRKKNASMGRSRGAPQINEYYRQARYSCGQLFVGNVVTSLTVNTFFNPSLWELVHQMIKAEVVMVPLPRDWEGKSYYEYFDKLLREDQLMPVAVYRRADAKSEKGGSKNKGKKWSYIYTAPPAKETHMQRGDRVICFASALKLCEDDLDVIETKDTKDKPLEDKEIDWDSKKKRPPKPDQKKNGPNNAVLMMQ